MSQELYHEALLALAKDKSHAGRLDPCDGSARADNPLCGDRVTLDLTASGGVVCDVAQKTRGCILTQAAAAMIARHAAGLSLDETARHTEAAQRFLAGEDVEAWPELAHFAPVRDVKSRHDCVLIAYEALEAAARAAASTTTMTEESS